MQHGTQGPHGHARLNGHVMLLNGWSNAKLETQSVFMPGYGTAGVCSTMRRCNLIPDPKQQMVRQAVDHANCLGQAGWLAGLILTCCCCCCCCLRVAVQNPRPLSRLLQIALLADQNNTSENFRKCGFVSVHVTHMLLTIPASGIHVWVCIRFGA